MRLSCKITPDVSAVSASGEEGGKIFKNTAEPIYMKIGKNIACALGFHLGV